MQRTRRTAWLSVLSVLSVLAACSGEAPDTEGLWSTVTSRVTTPVVETQGADGKTVVHQRPFLLDSEGRYVHLKGINVSGSHKAPPTEEFPSLYPLTTNSALRPRCGGEHVTAEFPLPEGCVPEMEVSYVGRPFPLDEADHWFGLLQSLGFNSIRFLTNWESVQPYRPGTCADRPGNYDADCHDLDYLEFYDALIAKAKEHGIYVVVDMHQDMWSRHLFAYYNERPSYEDSTTGETVYPEPGSVENMVLALFPPYTDWSRGHGAPRWACETAMPEKDFDSPYWGMYRILGGLKNPDGTLNGEAVGALTRVVGDLLGGDDGGPALPPWLNQILANLPDHFEVDQTSDFLPFRFWGVNAVLSMDVERGFAAFFAGEKVFPWHCVNDAGEKERCAAKATPGPGQRTVERYLKDHYYGCFRELASRAKKHDNVIGYDLMNEPVGVFIVLTAAAAYMQTGLTESIEGVLTSLAGEELGADLYAIVTGLGLVPSDNSEETLAKWGLADMDVFAALDLNLAFDAKYLQPFYEELGAIVQEEDPHAIIWFEPGASIRMLTGAGPQWDQPLTRPQGIRQLVFAPHWYPDIYPFLGINTGPREFNLDEWLYRDFRPNILDFTERAPAWLGNVPTVFGEFGTHMDFNGIETAIENDYLVSSHILNSYYEAFEDLNVGNMVWCFSADADYEYGELWNHEDFSVIDPEGEPRAWTAYVRTHARATSGKLIGQRFNSQHAYLDPDEGIHRPEREYLLEMETKETDAPTLVYVPERQYPDGFYAWLSDGVAYYDAGQQMLYWYPSKDAPGTVHSLRIRPPFDDDDVRDWSYFFRGNEVVNGKGGVR